MATGQVFAAAVNWTMAGVLLTAVFTGGLVVFTALAYRLATRELGASQRTLFKLPLVDVWAWWLEVADSPNETGFQARLFFENKHPVDPLRYQIEHLSLQVVTEDGSPYPGHTYEFGDPLADSGVVPPSGREAYSLPPVPDEDEGHGPLFAVSDAPHFFRVKYTVRYGAVRDHKDFRYEWRETRELVATLPYPPRPGAPGEVLPYVWTQGSSIESLTPRGRLQRVVRAISPSSVSRFLHGLLSSLRTWVRRQLAAGVVRLRDRGQR